MDWLTGKPATTEEISAALIAEAKRRGFKEGVTIKRPWDNQTLNLLKGKPAYYHDMNTLDVGKFTVFNKGKWAEIIEQPKEIDLSVQNSKLIELINQLLISLDFANGNRDAIYELCKQTKKRLQTITLK